MVRDLLRRAESDGTNVVLYGAGNYGRAALYNIKNIYHKINIKYFIDDDLDKINKDVDGVGVITLDNAVNILGNDIIIVISNYYITSTLKKIQKAGIDLSRVFFANEFLIKPVEISLIKENKENILKAYSFLEDYESKLIYKTMIECHFTYNIDVLSRTCHEKQYFPEDIFQLQEDEVFVDAGAFVGDTIDIFIQSTNNNFRYIYAFEPDNHNFCELTKNYGEQENIKLFNMGLYSEDKIVPFSACGDSSSSIESTGQQKIKVCSFDHLSVPDNKVSFIKMDIEGSELNALYGMAETIHRYTPKLAICIYHKFQDIWEILLFIKQLNSNYKFYIRNYTTYLDEIVLYAIVK